MAGTGGVCRHYKDSSGRFIADMPAPKPPILGKAFSLVWKIRHPHTPCLSRSGGAVGLHARGPTILQAIMHVNKEEFSPFSSLKEQFGALAPAKMQRHTKFVQIECRPTCGVEPTANTSILKIDLCRSLSQHVG